MVSRESLLSSSRLRVVILCDVLSAWAVYDLLYARRSGASEAWGRLRALGISVTSINKHRGRQLNDSH